MPTALSRPTTDSADRPLSIRAAMPGDIDALLAIETACFDSDRLSRRNFQHLLSRGHQATLVATAPDGAVIGYAMVLFHRGTSLARLYSLAVLPAWRGAGAARALLSAAETRAAGDAIALRLEVRADNDRAIRFYEAADYKPFGVYPAFYDDAADAIRMEKSLAPTAPPSASRFPYRAQTLNFTCGPACLLMALGGLGLGPAASRTEELRLWRESTTIFMARGHGGCSPYGLALAAKRRGAAATVHVSDTGTMLVDGVRRTDKKEVIRLVQADYLAQCAEAGIPVRNDVPDLDAIAAALDEGAAAIVLISTYALDRERTPHWVLVAAVDARYVYVHDPYVDPDAHQSQTDRMLLPIARRDFHRMSRFGKARQRAVVLLRRETA